MKFYSPLYSLKCPFVRGIQKIIRRAAINAMLPPNRKGAEGPNPVQAPNPCHKTPAMKEAGNASKPITAL
jgi:hypothetical protein